MANDHGDDLAARIKDFFWSYAFEQKVAIGQNFQ